MPMPMVKGWKINPFNQTITRVEWPQHNTHAMYALLSTPHNEVECFDHVTFSETEGVYVDDEGLLRWQGKQQEFFLLAHESFTREVPLAGNGLVCAVDDEGNSVDSQLTHEQLRSMIQWIDVNDLVRRARAGAFDAS